jgi:hypothetical protein
MQLSTRVVASTSLVLCLRCLRLVSRHGGGVRVDCESWLALDAGDRDVLRVLGYDAAGVIESGVDVATSVDAAAGGGCNTVLRRVGCGWTGADADAA